MCIPARRARDVCTGTERIDCDKLRRPYEHRHDCEGVVNHSPERIIVRSMWKIHSNYEFDAPSRSCDQLKGCTTLKH